MENKPVQPTKGSEKKRLGSSVGSLIKRIFSRDKTGMSILEEEALQTPGKMIFKNFFRKKLGVLGLVVFIGIIAVCVIGSQVWPLDLSYYETTMRNLRPGMNYLNYPRALEREGIEQITSGVSFSAALTKEGNVYVWGSEARYELDGMSSSIRTIPPEVQEADIVHLAAGDRHIVALDAQNNLYGWGVDNFRQASGEGENALFENLASKEVKKLFASEMYSGILFEDGTLYNWGSTLGNRVNIIHPDLQGHIVDVDASASNVVLLLDDGTVSTIGIQNPFSRVPEELQDGSVNIVDIACSYRAVMALDDQGELHLWGDGQFDIFEVPDFEGNIVSMDGGKNNMTLLTDRGEIVYWGADHYNQLTLPQALQQGDVVEVYSDMFQNYGVREDGSIEAWGNKGFLFGSDEMGRDLATRVLHGGRISLAVGAVAVIVATIIALVVGLTSGFLGGWVDHALMRLTDVVQAIPFLPLAVTLSAIIMGRFDEMVRIFMIMSIIGVLGWTGLARLVRAQILLEREKDFVLAARALGVRQKSIVIRHILPNVFNLVIVNVTLSYAVMILQESALSFLGFGVTAPTPSWGNILTSAQSSQVLEHYWWRWVIPGSFVVLAALSINLVGDALREAMDPKANAR